MDEEKLDVDLKVRALEELNETPENVRQGIDDLKRLILADENLFVPTNDAFLLRFLRARKFDSKKAFHVMQRYYLMKLRCPELFKAAVPTENQRVFDLQAQCMLQDRDHLGHRVYILRLDKLDSSEASIEEIFRTNMLALEQVVREPETQIAGLVVVVDMSGLNIHNAKLFTPYYARKLVEIVQETFPLRFRGFHVLREPFYMDALMAILRPFLKDKIRKRIYLHGNEVSSLHAFIKPEILPVEFGGLLGEFDNTPWKTDLLQLQDYLLEQDKYGYKETIHEDN